MSCPRLPHHPHPTSQLEESTEPHCDRLLILGMIRLHGVTKQVVNVSSPFEVSKIVVNNDLDNYASVNPYTALVDGHAEEQEEISHAEETGHIDNDHEAARELLPGIEPEIKSESKATTVPSYSFLWPLIALLIVFVLAALSACSGWASSSTCPYQPTLLMNRLMASSESLNNSISMATPCGVNDLAALEQWPHVAQINESGVIDNKELGSPVLFEW